MGMPQKIKKRDGRVVDFDPKKINIAINKAFIAMQGGIHEEKLNQITEAVVKKLAEQFPVKTPSVEDIQNIVENVLMTEGFYAVAKDYIIYRYEHSKKRAVAKEELIKKIEQSGIYVTKRSGKKEKLYLNKLRNTLAIAIKGYERVVDQEEIVKQCQKDLYDNIPTREIAKALVLTTRSWAERDRAYSKVAAR